MRTGAWPAIERELSEMSGVDRHATYLVGRYDSIYINVECIAVVDRGVLAALLSKCDRAQSVRTKRNRSRLEYLRFPEVRRKVRVRHVYMLRRYVGVV